MILLNYLNLDFCWQAMNLLEEKYTLAALSINQFRHLAHINTTLKILLKWLKS